MKLTPGMLLAAIALASCAASIDPGSDRPIRRVLFVGNSLTYYNNMPATVAAIARDNGDSLTVSMAAEANLALIDHLNGGSKAPELLRDSSWDAVVLQQGPTSTGGVCRDSLILWTQMFAPLIKKAGGVSVSLMVWPAISQGNVWAAVHESSAAASGAVHGWFAPAGDAWHTALTLHPGLPLYGGDGYHPSEMGSFLTALVVYQKLTGRDPRTLAPHAFANGQPWPMRADTLSWLAEAAFSANVGIAEVAPPPTLRTIPGSGSGGAHC